ncbi:uncharacterized protein LOC142242516 [Haematobia irritans]|uniref:uncharacterized protein LOC142242516 n=1 Tax=Haematobia irritans TaxID=7368 RepID=UPI003F4F6487
MEVLKPFLFNIYKSNGVSHFNEMCKELQSTEFDISAFKYVDDYNNNVRLCCDLAIKSRDVLFNEDPSTIPLAKVLIKIKKLLYGLFVFFMVYNIYNSFFKSNSNAVKI